MTIVLEVRDVKKNHRMGKIVVPALRWVSFVVIQVARAMPNPVEALRYE